MDKSATHFGIVEAQRRLEELIERVFAGEEIILTRWGKPLGKLVSADSQPKSVQVLEIR
jgi:prevent-host-death family protein